VRQVVYLPEFSKIIGNFMLGASSVKLMHHLVCSQATSLVYKQRTAPTNVG